MFKIGVYGNTNNYFFNEAIKAFNINNELTFDLEEDDIDFIFCCNEIRPLINNPNVPIITWIGERPTWVYIRETFGLRCADLIFITEREFVESVKKFTGNNQVYYLPLATSFKLNQIKFSKTYHYEILFVGNTMKKQITDMEKEKNLFLKLPLLSEDFVNIHNIIRKIKFVDLKKCLSDYIKELSDLNGYVKLIEKYSMARQDLFYGYLGMLLTHHKRLYTLSELAKIYPELVLFPTDWNEFIGYAHMEHEIAYDAIKNIYASSMININISSMHMPTSLNSRVFDVPSSGSFLITDYREGIYDVFEDDEMIVYSSIEELKEYINYYKSHEKQRETMILKARKRIQNEHMYLNRINHIIEKFKLLLR